MLQPDIGLFGNDPKLCSASKKEPEGVFVQACANICAFVIKKVDMSAAAFSAILHILIWYLGS